MVGGTLITEAQFNTHYIERLGRYVVHVPKTRTIDNITGEESLSADESSASVILAVFLRLEKKWMFDKVGLIEGGDAYLVSRPSAGVVKDDFIYANGTDLAITNIDGNATTITVDTSTNHGLSVADKVFVGGTTNYDGLYTVASTPSATQFTISDVSHDLAAETVGIVTKGFDSFIIKNHIERYGKFGGAPEKTYDYSNLFLHGDV